MVVLLGTSWSRVEYFGDLIQTLARNDDRHKLLKAPLQSFEVYYGDSLLFSIEQDNRWSVNVADGKYRHDVIETLDRIGFLGLSFEFNNSSSFPTSNLAKGAKIEIKDIMLSTTNGPNYVAGFVSRYLDDLYNTVILNDSGGTVYLVPDTNVLRRRYFSNFIQGIEKREAKKVEMLLPRIAVLEIERQYVSASKKSHSLTKRAKAKDKDNAEKEKDELFEAEKEIRLSLNTVCEIINIRDHRGDMLPILDKDLLLKFDKEAGYGTGDAWIRREIIDDMEKTENELIKSTLTIPNFRYVFLTCDRMNALCAAAEGINTLYVSRDEQTMPYMNNGHYANLSKLLVETAITFGQCSSVSRYPNGDKVTVALRSTWPQKSLEDWQNRVVLMNELLSPREI